MAPSTAKISPRPGLTFHSWQERELTTTTMTSGRQGPGPLLPVSPDSVLSWPLTLLPSGPLPPGPAWFLLHSVLPTPWPGSCTQL